MKKAGIALWISMVVFSCVVIGLKLSTGLPIESNLLALLPTQNAEEKWVQKAKETMQAQASGRIIVVVSHADIELAQNAANDLRKALEAKNYVRVSKGGDQKAAAQITGQVFFPYRMGLLSQQDREYLKTGDAASIGENAIAQLFSPFGIVDSDLIQSDPYLLLLRYFTELPIGQSEFDMIGGFPVVEKDGGQYLIIDMELAGEPFSPIFQSQFIPYFHNITKDLQAKYSGLGLKKVGAVFYADHATSGAKKEASQIGAISIIAILALVFFVFRGLQTIWMSLLVILSGITFGFAVNLIIFDNIHLMALVFGAGLMGISVDYAFHYCCERFSTTNTTPSQRINAISNGLSLGLVSSVIGFMMLAWAPFPGLQQIAVFSAAGLIMSYMTVLIIFPALDHSGKLEFTEKRFWPITVFQKLWEKADNNRSVKWIGGAVCLIVVATGYFQLDLDDDIRRLQSLPTDLLAEETAIKQLSGIENDAQFYLVSAATQEFALIEEEALRSKLDLLIKHDGLSGYTALSVLVPSVSRQLENRKLVSDQLLGVRLNQFLQDIDLTDIAGYSDHSDDYLTLAQLETLEGFASYKLLQIENSKGNTVHLVVLKGVKDVQGLASLGTDAPHIRFIDPAKDISEVLADYRHRALILLSVACMIIFGFLSWHYGVQRALKVITVPVLAVVMTPFIIALTGNGFTFFNAMALMLVFALGLDYAIFCTESTKEHFHISLLANGLSALSTIFAFGLLSLSQQYAVHAFGQTILIGIILAFGLAPFARQYKQEYIQ